MASPENNRRCSAVLTEPAELGRARRVVLGLLCALSMITYLDRVCFGVAAPLLAQEMGLAGAANLKWAITAFAIAYSAFEIPSGWLGDTLGPRSTLIRIVAWWSICTALTGLVGYKIGDYALGGLGTLIVLRFLFGAGEAGAYPNITRALHNWFPVARWGSAQGMVWMSARLMGGITPLIWTLLVTGTAYTPALTNWRGAFLLFGLLGLTWCALFAAWFRNTPTERLQGADAANQASGGSSEAVGHQFPWRAMLSNRSLWMLCLMYLCMTYGWVFHITYLPEYLPMRFELPKGDLLAAVYVGGPLWVGAIGCLGGGLLLDALIRRSGDRHRARRWVGGTGQALCAVGWLAALVAPNEHVFFLAISLAALCNDLTMGAAWATCQDLGQRYAAVAAATMNTIATIGAAVTAWLTGSLVEWSVDRAALAAQVTVADLPSSEARVATILGYNQAFVTFAVAYGLSALCWLVIDARQPLDQGS